jgi:hypothetical protein
MKNFTPAAIIAAFASTFVIGNLSAETVLANFETGLGTEKINEVVYCQTNTWVLFNGLVANTVKDETMNNTDNCYMVQLDANYDWWGNFLDFHILDPITVTEDNRYLHILHYRSVINDPYWVCLNTDWNLEDADKGKLRFDGNNKKAGVWEDIVIDMKNLIETGTTLTKFNFAVSNDWSDPKDNPGGLYYFDEIVLNNSSLPRGINILEDTTMELFLGNETSYNKWVSKYETQHSENTSEIVDNPFTTETAVLNSPKVMMFNKSANASWWQGPRFVFPGIYQVGRDAVSSYLHAMVNIPEMEASKEYYNIMLVAKDFSGTEVNSSDALKYWSDDKGKWVDFVFDVTSLGYVNELQVRFDVRKDEADAYINSPAGSFYLDAFTIDNNPDPRASVIQGISTTKENKIKVFTSDNCIMIEGNVAQIEIFNIVGQLVSKTAANKNLTSVSVKNGGIYVVKAVATNGGVTSTKVLVQ